MKKLITAVIILFSSIAFANDELPKLYSTGLPALCGPTVEVQKVAEEKGMVIFSVSNGRVGASQDGEIAYYVTHWVEPKGGSQMLTVTTLDGKETCIYFISFDTVINPNLTGGTGI